MSRLTAGPRSAASDNNAAPFVAVPICVKKRGGRDPDKYTWLPPDPPRVPRQDPLTPVQAGLCLLGALIATAIVFLASMGFISLFCRPAA